MPISISPIEGRRALGQFLRLPWTIYRKSPYWVPPLIGEIRRRLDTAKNPFFQYAQAQLLGAYDSRGNLVGRVAAIHNPLHQREYGEAAGFFGFFECVNDVDAARSLFDAVATVLQAHGCTFMVGPVNPSTNDESGFLMDNFNERATFMTNYCPEYYHQLMRACGFDKAIDTLSYQAQTYHPFPEKYERVLQRARDNPSIRVRHFDRKNAHSDIAIIRDLYNTSFRGTWGFVPLSKAEAEQLADSFLSFADFNLVWLAYYDDKPVGFILGLPDLNEILALLNGRLFPFGIVTFLARRNRIGAVRVLGFGVLPEYRSLGIETLLVYQVRERILNKIYKRAEFSVVMENNTRMRNFLEAFGFHLHKHYRIYRKDL
jgi:ribosomal protein S18 acetylase RimI-like enzyme